MATYLQDVNIWDLSWNAERSYGEIWLPFEKGQCHYNFEASDPERLKQLFAIYEAEAAALIEVSAGAGPGLCAQVQSHLQPAGGPRRHFGDGANSHHRTDSQSRARWLKPVC